MNTVQVLGRLPSQYQVFGYWSKVGQVWVLVCGVPRHSVTTWRFVKGERTLYLNRSDLVADIRRLNPPVGVHAVSA